MSTPLNPADRVREHLRRWLDTTKLSQRELAGELGRTQVWLQKVLEGKNQVRLRDLDRIAATLRTSASELVRADEDRYQLELTPTEVRIIERLRRRPALIDAISVLLDAKQPSEAPKSRKRAT